MNTTLALLRHGRAAGPSPEAALLPEGAGDIATLGRRLAREGFAPVAAFSSPYLRALESSRILLSEVAPALTVRLLPELTPEHDPDDTLAMLAAQRLPGGRVLIVSHMPLLGLLARRLTGEHAGFHPGTLIEIALREDFAAGTLSRVLDPRDVIGG